MRASVGELTATGPAADGSDAMTHVPPDQTPGPKWKTDQSSETLPPFLFFVWFSQGSLVFPLGVKRSCRLASHTASSAEERVRSTREKKEGELFSKDETRLIFQRYSGN